MVEILEMLQRVDLLLRERIGKRSFGGGEYDKRAGLAEARELIQKAITKILLASE